MRPTFTQTNKNIGTFLSKVLMSPSCIKEDAKQKKIREKRKFQETFAKHKVSSLAFQN